MDLTGLNFAKKRKYLEHVLESYIMDPSYRPALHPCILIQPNSPIAAMLQIPCVPHQLDQATLSVMLKNSFNGHSM